MVKIIERWPQIPFPRHFWAIFSPLGATCHFLCFGQFFPIFHSMPGGLTSNDWTPCSVARWRWQLVEGSFGQSPPWFLFGACPQIFLARDSRAGKGCANFMGAWELFWLFLLRANKIPRSVGRSVLGFGGARSANFQCAGGFSERCARPSYHLSSLHLFLAQVLAAIAAFKSKLENYAKIRNLHWLDSFQELRANAFFFGGGGVLGWTLGVSCKTPHVSNSLLPRWRHLLNTSVSLWPA